MDPVFHRVFNRALRLTLLGLVGAFLVALLAVGYGLLRPEALKPVAGYLLERHTGRELEIAGPIALDLSLQPHISLERVRISNPEWASAPNFFTAERLRVRIDLRELLQRRLRLLSVDLSEGGALHLEKAQDGASTWDLLQPDSAAGPGFQLQIEKVALADTAVTLLLPGRDETRFDVAELSGAADVDGVLELFGRGAVGENPWQIDGRFGTLSSLLTRADIELDVSMRVRDLQLSFVGKVGDAASMRGVNLQSTVRGPDASVYGELIGMPGAFDGDVALDTTLRSSEDGLQVSTHGHVADYEIAVDAAVRDPVAVDGVAASVTISGPDAAVLLKALNAPALVSGPFQLSGSGIREGGLLRLQKVRGRASDTRLSLDADFDRFPSLEGATVELAVEGGDLDRVGEVLGVTGLPRAPYQLQARVEPAAGSVTATLDVGGHELTAEGVLGEFPDFVGSRFRLRGTGAEFLMLGRLIGIGDKIPGRYQTSAEVSVAPQQWQFNDVYLTTVVGTGSGSVTLTGTRQALQIDIDAVLEVEDLAAAGGYFGIDGLPRQPVRITTRMQRNAGRWRLDSGRARGNTFTLTASGELGRLNGPAGLDLAVRLEGQSLGRLVGLAMPEGIGARPFKLATGVSGQESTVELVDLRLTTADSRLQLDGRLPLTPGLIGADVTVQADGQDLAAMLPPLGDYRPPSSPFKVRGHLARPGSRELHLDSVNAAVGGASIVANGTLNLTAQTASELLLTARGPSLAELGSFRELRPDLPFEVDVTLKSDRQSVSYEDLRATLGENDISGRGSLSWAGDVPKLYLRGASKRLRLPGTGATSGGEQGEAGKVFSQTPLPFEYLSVLDADIALSVDELRGLGNWLDGVTLVAVLENGELDLRQLDFEDAYGSFAARGRLRRDGDGGSVAMTLTGSGLDMRLLTSNEQPEDSKPRYDLEADIASSGRSIAELAAGLNGKILLSADGGLLDSRNADLLGGDFMTKLVETANPFSRTERFTRMECAVLNAKVASGVVRLEPGLVLRTDKLNLYIAGKADLGAELLDLSVATQARQGVGISAGSLLTPFFRIGGALSQPKMQFDKTNAAYAAAVMAATGGMSIVARGLWGRFRNEHNPCETYRQEE